MTDEKRTATGDKARPIKVVETMVVTDDKLEEIINEWVGRGYVLDGIHFAMHESSKRPAMAFLVFYRKDA
ncbi:MAG TPA: DUF4177 domain-containing protein [Proteobacteria bacterium]|nr:DUF4177 domain-containing protein [Pseudomonadota bacterium]